PDFIVGLPLASAAGTAGSVRVYSGATGTLIWSQTFGLLYGFRVANAGDVNADGIDDVIVASGSYASPSPPALPPVLVLSGSGGGTIWSIPGLSVGAISPYDSWGISLGGAVDLDSDGSDDVLIGWSSGGGLGNQHGEVVAFSGATGGVLHV